LRPPLYYLAADCFWIADDLIISDASESILPARMSAADYFFLSQ